MFLSQIEGFIRRKTTYSPKISEELIPVIFRVALAKKMPMTKFVKHILRDYLEKNHQTEYSQLREKEVSYERKSPPSSRIHH